MILKYRHTVTGSRFHKVEKQATLRLAVHAPASTRQRSLRACRAYARNKEGLHIDERSSDKSE